MNFWFWILFVSSCIENKIYASYFHARFVFMAVSDLCLRMNFSELESAVMLREGVEVVWYKVF